MDLIWIVLRGVLALALVIGCLRIVGLRSLAKFTAFDFVLTLAIGSTLATAAAATSAATYWTAMVALLVLFGLTAGLGRARRVSEAVEDGLDNCPVLLMRDGEFLEHAMDRVNVTRGDLVAKLREANVLRLSDVRAVVFETTGDISVLHGDGPVDDLLLDGVTA